MTRTARPAARVRLLALPALAALLASGCSIGPVRTGAAATVGQDRITSTALQRVVDRGLADPMAQQQLGADRPAFQRQVLSRLITGDLLHVAARRRGVRVTEGEVDGRIDEFSRQLGGRAQLDTQAAQSGIARPDLRPFLRDLTLNDKLADFLVRSVPVPEAQLAALYRKNLAQYDQVRARHILLKTAAEAQQVLAQVRADPARFASIAAARSLDEGSKAKGGELASAGRGAYVKPFEDALFSTPIGQPRIVRTEFGFHVYEVLERRTTTLQQAAPVLRRQALQPQREAAIAGLLRSTAATERVTVNPRFGRWDARSASVVETRASGPGVVSSPAPDGAPGSAGAAQDPLAPGGAGGAAPGGGGGAAPEGVAPGEPAPDGSGQQAPQQQAPQEQAPQQRAPQESVPQQQPPASPAAG